MELTVYNYKGEDLGRKVILNESIFNIQPNDHVIWLDVKNIQANQRQGTHKTKERSEMSGSTRKLKIQKGTGGARAGDINNPLFVGGGRVFGPRPRDYHFKMNKKTKRLARLSALSYKALENRIIIVEDFTFDAPKTKTYAEFLKNFKLNDQRSLLVVNEPDQNLLLASRNIPYAKIMRTVDLNTVDILKANRMIFFESSLPVLENLYAESEN
ncbi:MAG TPA: 50S ribosomal protein L4 [Bacteroidales bacterium]|jgi:large subunit ribosomal protein L4|nr:50S ribosomal protein L4 [Bacteroidales bacterium]MDI9574356.1 50S ribosomal protein L4 [Bacteroidota bacterium]MBP9512209.1 50S ribosomal protein L4 [Bacteroidales bacterium]MBP9587546.1 50S ribosomal protein L4 [Bacteroidales bacterium]NMD15666.1 50S ribosomal protein L4 [Bacteroidales bacterium]